MKILDQERELEVDIKGKKYTLVVNEYMGSGLKYLLRCELHGDNEVNLFLMGIPLPAEVYSHAPDTSPEAIVSYIYKSAVDAITKYVVSGSFVESNSGLYYGQYTQEGFFEIIGSQKPAWDDGSWGQRVDLSP